MLPCAPPLKRRTIAKELFKIVDDFMKQRNITSDCVVVCTDGACIMAGNEEGLQAFN
jgi:hypothetical protein